MSTSFFDCLDHETAKDVEMLSRAIYELRESRKRVLAETGHDDETALLDAIRDGAVAEHPGYELYLAARVMDQAREDARMALRPEPDERPAHCLHAALCDTLEQKFVGQLAGPVELLQDALRFALDGGLEVTARFAADDAWSIEWREGDALARIDTAPHTAPNTANEARGTPHYHDADGGLHLHTPFDSSGLAEDVIVSVVTYLLETRRER